MTATNPKQNIDGGLVVFFEGMDGTGKTTQLGLAQQVLESSNYLVETTRIHGGSPIGEALREVSLSRIERPALTDMYLALAVHSALAPKISMWRQAGAIVLVDRSPLSIVAYQQYGDGLSSEIVSSAVKVDMEQFAPDLTIIYDAPVETAVMRAKNKNNGDTDYFEAKDGKYFDRVRAGYLACSKQMECLLVGSGDATIETVAAVTQAAIQSIVDYKRL